MSGTTNTVRIDDRQVAAWAQEATLHRVASATEASNTVLQALAKRWNLNVSGIQQVSTASAGAAQGLAAAGTQSKLLGKSFGSFDKSLNDLRYSMGGWTRTLSSSSGALGLLPGVVQGIGGSAASAVGGMASLGRAATPLSAIITVLTTVVTMSAERMMTYVDTYRSMMQAGITFDGNLLNMAATVRRAGVSFSTATQIAQRQTTMLLVTGEQNFFKTVRNMEGSFSRFALTMDQGAELTAEFMESQRLSGALYSSSQGELEDANVRMLNLMKAQERITGVNVRRQQEEQQAVMRRASVRLLLSRRSPEEQRRAGEVTTRLRTQLGLSEDAASSLMTEMLTGIPTKAGAELRVLFGSAIDDVVAGGRSQLEGQTTGMDAAVEAMKARAERVTTEMGTTLAVGFETGNAFLTRMATTLVGIKDAIDPSTIGPRAETLQQAFNNIRDGLPIMDRATETIYTFQNRASVVAGSLEAAAASSAIADYALRGLTRTLEQLIRVTEGRGPGLTPTAITPAEQRPVTGATPISEAEFEGTVPTPATLREISQTSPNALQSPSALRRRRAERETAVSATPPAVTPITPQSTNVGAETMTQAQVSNERRRDALRTQIAELQAVQTRNTEQNTRLEDLIRQAVEANVENNRLTATANDQLRGLRRTTEQNAP